MLLITPKAVVKLQKFLKQNPKYDGFVLGVENSSCSGLTYTINAATSNSNGVLFGMYGQKILIEGDNLKFFEGVTLDYEELDGFTEKFTFKNEKADSCGCGISFNI